MNTQKKTKGRSCTGSRVWRILLFVLLILLTLMEAVWCGAAAYAWKEMRHEGLTYSQWYEGSVDWFYFSLMIVIVHTQIWLAAWYAFIRRFLRRSSGAACAAPRSQRTLNILLSVFLVLTALAAYGYVHETHLLKQMRAANAEVLIPYIRRAGVSRILLAFAAAGSAILGLKRICMKRAKEQR